MTCVAAFTSLALPALSVILLLLCRYWAAGSWSQASAAQDTRTVDVNVMAAKQANLMMLSSSLSGRRRPDYVAAGGRVASDHVAVGALNVAAPRHVIFVGLAHLHPPVQEE